MSHPQSNGTSTDHKRSQQCFSNAENICGAICQLADDLYENYHAVIRKFHFHVSSMASEMGSFPVVAQFSVIGRCTLNIVLCPGGSPVLCPCTTIPWVSIDEVWSLKKN